MSSLTWTEWKRREDEPRRRIRIDLEAARRALNAALNASEGVNFTDEERELMADSLAKVRARLNEADEALRKQARR